MRVWESRYGGSIRPWRGGGGMDFFGRLHTDEVYSRAMAGKVTLYVRDEELWDRARTLSGPAGLSDLVQQALRQWLDRAGGSASPPSLLERARQLRDDADALVQAVEADPAAGRSSAKRQPRPRRRLPSR